MLTLSRDIPAAARRAASLRARDAELRDDALTRATRRASALSPRDDGSHARSSQNRRSNGRGSFRRGGGGGDPLAAAEAAIAAMSGLVINLDARDKSAGAIASWIDRQYGYDFAGTATRDATINGRPTITGNGTSNILTSTAAISQLTGASAATVVFAAVDTNVAATAIILEHGAPGASGPTVYATSAGERLHSYGQVTAVSNYYAAETLAVAAVITTRWDTTLSTGEANLIRKNGAALSTVLVTDGNNTGTIASNTMSLLARNGGSFGWAGSLAKALVFSRVLTAGEMLTVERAVGVITGIAVA